MNAPRPWGQTSGVHAGQRSRVPGSPPRLCRPRCRLSLADVGSLLGGSVCVCWEITQNLVPHPPPPPATSYANRRALHRMRSAVPGAASPGPRPCPSLHDGGPPARPPSIWRHRGPVAAPWPRSAWPGHHCPPRQAHSLPLGRPDSAPPALTPPPAPSPPSLCLPPRVLLLCPKPRPPLTRQITTRSISPLVPWEGSLYLCAPSCSPVSPQSPEQCLPRRGRLSRVFGGSEQLRE